MKIRTLTHSITLASATLVMAGTAQAQQELRIQTSFNSGDYAYQYLQENWVPKVEEMTGGDVTINLMPIGSVVPYKETLEAVGMGLLDGDLTAPAYFAGRDPAFALMGDLIAGYDKPSQFLDFCQNGGGEEVLQKAIDKVVPNRVHVVGCGPYKREALVAAKPIRSVEDLQGLKFRSPEGLAAAVFERAGATPVNIPFSEVYTSLQQGVVDAADASAYVNNDASGLHDIAKYPIYPGIHSMSSQQFTLNENTWESLSEEDQKALSQWFYDAFNDLAGAVHQQDEKLVARDKAKGDITVIDWPQEERDKFREIARGAWEDFAQKSPIAQEALNAHLEYMKAHGLLEDNAAQTQDGASSTQG
ncbi:TRAP transporter substrate-binding protein [Halomonas sp. McH1-25]|uniref:TRAP transporter substrate-binding protein n=1 Tax=unclassified Halomonas TaxID=2609666 RepID=UPI001EF5C490|nr:MULTISPECIES: TRAP transporter substrate-binding protein [unclassified Halomonas]MCG7599181.1 TRAP transporter substrate-binding protein [Halomonas sp. McH1-25]MCP1344773.1 TRAP transporter substrate-binding protein [Halomonas sp. FL8]MCP1363168.1 TRAP transporter substrate-binding protein [Halomonas sp. BBD45]MCP1365382.1 TRAP transporter substrate-binding protein [Halomonas sp. BBD48]